RADRHRSFLMSFSRIPRPMGANKIKEFWQFFLSQTKSVWVFILGNTWGNKMSKSHSVDAATGGHRLVAGMLLIRSAILRASPARCRQCSGPLKTDAGVWAFIRLLRAQRTAFTRCRSALD